MAAFSALKTTELARSCEDGSVAIQLQPSGKFWHAVGTVPGVGVGVGVEGAGVCVSASSSPKLILYWNDCGGWVMSKKYEAILVRTSVVAVFASAVLVKLVWENA